MLEVRNEAIRGACFVLLLGLVSGVSADTQVNTYTLAFQGASAIAVAADGDFVVVWGSIGSSDSDTDGSSIQGQRFASDGSEVGGEFQVNSYTTGEQVSPEVGVAANGDFVVVWQSTASAVDLSGNAIHGQRYSSDGSTLGVEFLINSYTTSDQSKPSVCGGDDGDFVVVWQSQGSLGVDTDQNSIHGQRYASSGSAVGGEFEVNSYTTSYQRFASVGCKPDGGFVVTWESAGSASDDSSLESIQGQRYSSAGATLGVQFQVNTYTTNTQETPGIGVGADGGFVVTWQSLESALDSSGTSIQGQRFGSDGSSLGGQFQVNTYTTLQQNLPSVAIDAAGDFVVVWESYSSGADSDYTILGQRYSSSGGTIGGEMQVNTLLTDGQTEPSVAIDPSGGVYGCLDQRVLQRLRCDPQRSAIRCDPSACRVDSDRYRVARIPAPTLILVRLVGSRSAPATNQLERARGEVQAPRLPLPRCRCFPRSGQHPL